MRIGQPEPKRGNITLLVALVALSLVMLTVYFREGDSGLFHRARGSALAIAAPVERAGTAITSPVRGISGFFEGIGVSKTRLAALEKQNEELRTRLAELEEARQENERLRGLVEFAEERRLSSLGARVIGRPVSAWEGVITIDRGSNDGVKPGMPVVAAQGLVGQVASVSRKAATVRLLTDQQSGVAAMVQSSRALGVVRGSISGSLSLDFLDRTALPQAGDVAITSGLGGVYPRGIVIGDVTAVDDRRGELFPRITIAPRVPMDRVEEVLVLVGAVVEAGTGDVE